MKNGSGEKPDRCDVMKEEKRKNLEKWRKKAEEVEESRDLEVAAREAADAVLPEQSVGLARVHLLRARCDSRSDCLTVADSLLAHFFSIFSFSLSCISVQNSQRYESLALHNQDISCSITHILGGIVFRSPDYLTGE